MFSGFEEICYDDIMNSRINYHICILKSASIYTNTKCIEKKTFNIHHRDSEMICHFSSSNANIQNIH